MLPVDSIPPFLHSRLQQSQELWQHRAPADQQQQLEQLLQQHPQLPPQLARVFVASDFVLQSACDRPQAFVEWVASGLWEAPLTQDGMQALLGQRLASVGDDDKAFDRALRQFRRDMMLRIVWRDFCRLAPMTETTADMTALAEVVIQASMAFHDRLLQARYGQPIGRYSKQPQPLVVLGMGKMGGYELNVSSDIDLIFSYPESGETEGGRKSISNQEYFIKLGQKIITSIDSTTVDGFVFRVDMRLRPYGQSGPLVANFDSLEEYYQTQGREWERYAMIKARVVSGDQRTGDVMPGGVKAGEQLMEMLRPFTYRRYLDYSAIESMRDMKALINREVQRKGINSDVKLGAGGIREVEFIVQVFQMIRGGRDVRLRERQVLKLLPLLEEEGFLPEGAADELAQAYTFLRNTEHAIQGYQDKQTQSLPVDKADLERLAWVMGFGAANDFLAELDRHRALVNDHFQKVIAEPEREQQQGDELKEWESLWPKGVGPQLEVTDLEGWARHLEQAGLQDAMDVAGVLQTLATSRAVSVMQPEGRTRLDALMPRLLKLLAERQEPVETLRRVLSMVEAVTRRTAYLLLLVENPGALQQLVRLCSVSSMIADQLAKHPALLDELLDPRALYQPPDKAQLRDELRQQMLRISWEDLESQMETLRYFRMAHGLRVAASEVADMLPLMKVSDYLTWLAEVILEHVVELGWQQMQVRHGRPTAGEGEPEPEFVVVGYGKLGGIELGHGSDLDLVFIHNAPANRYSDGDKELDNQTYFTRLGQKVIHILNTQTVSGQLYEVDMRLRPSGNSGLLVSSLTAFEKYQREEAWTWEHQALTRARVVAGGGGLAEQFEQLRADLLAQPRELDKLRQEVVEMREKMRSHLGTKGGEEEKAAQFHLKQDAGGIVDIEFLVQYSVLAWAHQDRSLTRWSDNIRVLESLQAAGLMEAGDAEQLIEAYKAYRSAGHLLALQRQPGVVAGDQFVVERANVTRIWGKYLGAE
ncbi:bifunctional [glutamate--ammonia ligase]-adenylyl-L-tyrosine phosphorylase/[glutamate--ammonia-ligase] adenylyltransferase [Pseudomaricurvus sp. HS19]|uniref:bifunctional [glutamate--ammonia ligase]-adenylyl-L-tyrosine phosphorylase/[glutamate--ammonia-ligase] adenylyltransferase n=1 Tax=Pseudomaricurvus sp. HS19 TaxID=2692626 RepID=UPI001929387F|nr:bifunctional [glutamate--ammonia ligase]-adenylyl-L-tyrosine phosphorylase/[glutamate--ammonia-ligase] adenylyltransferase [Pseudomaricurvus sp. HS19]